MRRAQQIAFLRSLGVLPPEQPGRHADEEQQAPSFDGGVREPAIETSDPWRDHDELALLVAQRAKWGLGPRE